MRSSSRETRRLLSRPTNRNCATYLCYILHFLCLCAWSITSTVPPSQPLHQCKFPGGESSKELKHLDALKSLWGKTYTVEFVDQESVPSRTYTYSVGICVKASIDSDDDAGVVQQWREKDSSGQETLQTRVVGQFTSTTIKGGNEWKFLTYENGDEYHHHCQKNAKRRANIMFICDREQTIPFLRVLEENSQKNDSCYYLLEMATAAVCPPLPPSILPPGVSAGSVVVILATVFIGCYLVIGCVYQRFIVGAKGFEQIPNLHFWQEVGNLMADGCNFVFRTNGPKIGDGSGSHTTSHSTPGTGGGYSTVPTTSSPGSRAYKGLGDNLLSEGEDFSNGGGRIVDGERDDHLLPM